MISSRFLSWGVIAFLVNCPHALALVHSSRAGTGQAYNLHVSDSYFTANDAYDASFNGSSGNGDYQIDIQENSGTITQLGTVTNVVVTQQIPWAGTRTLYAIIGVNSQAVLLGWIYCTSDNSIEDLWLEDTTGTMGFTSQKGGAIRGTCNISASPTTGSMHTSKEDISVSLPDVYPTMEGGSKLSLTASGVGSVTLGDEEFDLVPFAIVDCSDCQTQSGQTGNGWFETHSVMKAKDSSNICLGIFYLPTHHVKDIQLAYVNCFGKQMGSQTFYDVTYQIPARQYASSFSLKMQSAYLPY